ncbi:lanthionine synthetase C family protein [Streptomyces sp. enrichment culture]|uniref:lanthionine synthetase C family protein n=1 Tax=Streptomyces sp. enrichment culture TaxID=1795815 RepID=UPI003F56FFE1
MPTRRPAGRHRLPRVGGGRQMTPSPHPQSLYFGAAGITLLHAVRAGAGDADAIRPWASDMLRSPIVATAHQGIGLYEGAPAVAYVLTFVDTPAAERLLTALDDHVRRITAERLDTAHDRITRGQIASNAEFDLISGLTGLGVYHLRHGNTADLNATLSYLVRLTEPITSGGQTLPGWWATGSPGPKWPVPGHGNFGLAHGIAGPLALLATAALRGHTVAGHMDAITRICQWLHSWRIGTGLTTRWPEWIDPQEQHRSHTLRIGPTRPSWCYGTPGVARALQLAGRALGDASLQEHAEQALAGCLLDPEQTSLLSDTSLCHGWTGLIQATRRAAEDEKAGRLHDLLPRLHSALMAHLEQHGPPLGHSLMEGSAGLELIRLTELGRATPDPQWDLCLLLSG